MSWKRALVGCTMLISLAGLAIPAEPADAASGITVVYKLTASTHIKKLNQDVTIKNGTMTATVDLATGKLSGHLKLPPATVTTYEAGIGVLTATFQMTEAKPVTGKVNFGTLHVTATSVFNILIKDAHAGPIPINLVGNSCTTATPVSVTMSGTANFTGPNIFKGVYTIPDFANCSLMTPILNQLIPGPGNTFKAVAVPKT